MENIVQNKNSITRTQAKKSVEILVELIKKTLKSGEDVLIPSDIAACRI